MHRIDSATATEQGLFTGGSPGGGVPATQFTPEWCNSVQEEIANFILAQGLPLDKLDDMQLTAALEAALLGRRQFSNELVNGDFSIWQRGTAFPFPTGTAIKGYVADRFYANADLTNVSGGAATITRQAHALAQTAVPGDPPYYLRFNQSIAAVAAVPYLRQRVEGVGRFFGKALKVSVYMRSDVAINATLYVERNFGTGGSATDQIHQETVAVENGWTRHVFDVTVPPHGGETVGTFPDFLEFRIELPTGATFSCDFSDFMVQFGTFLSPYARIPASLEELRALRYFEKSYPLATAPGVATGLGSALVQQDTSGTDNVYGIGQRFRVEKAGPSCAIRYFSPLDGAAHFVRANGANSAISGSPVQACPTHQTPAWVPLSAAPGGTADVIGLEWTVEAEL